MYKLALCILFMLGGGAVMLALRHQELEINHRIVALQSRIQSRQARLWNQHVQIGIVTSPEAVRRSISEDMALVPEFTLPDRPSSPRLASARHR